MGGIPFGCLSWGRLPFGCLSWGGLPFGGLSCCCVPVSEPHSVRYRRANTGCSSRLDSLCLLYKRVLSDGTACFADNICLTRGFQLGCCWTRPAWLNALTVHYHHTDCWRTRLFLHVHQSPLLFCSMQHRAEELLHKRFRLVLSAKSPAPAIR